MKKFKLILFVILGIFVFNSCEDKDPATYQTSDQAFKTITTLKSIIGLNLSDAQVKLGNLGFALSESQSPTQEFTMHTFISNFTSDSYIIFEANNKIFSCNYISEAEKNIALNGFEKNSKECVAYMSGKTYEYQGETTIENEEDSIFTTHQELANYYVANKYNLLTCFEVWQTTKEGVSSQFSAPNFMSESFMSILIYADFELTPASMLKKDLMLKNILSNIKQK